MHHNQMRSAPGMQDWFHDQKSHNIIHHSQTEKEKGKCDLVKIFKKNLPKFNAPLLINKKKKEYSPQTW